MASNINPEIFDIEMEDPMRLEESSGKRSYIRITSKNQLESIIVIKSDSASLMVPEVELEIVAGTGRYTSLYQLLSEHVDKIKNAGSFYEEEDESAKIQFERLQTKISDFMEGRRPFTIVIDDPFSRTSLRLNDVDPMPEVIHQNYQRSAEQCEEYDIGHHRVHYVTDSYPCQDEEYVDPFDLTVEDHNLAFKIYQEMYDLEKWVDKLKQYTFDTIIEPINAEEALFLVNSYDERHPSLDDEESNNNEEQVNPDIAIQLEAKLDRMIKRFNGGAFVRLSARSPKDAIERSPQFKSILADVTEKEKAEKNMQEFTTNHRDICWYKANLYAMRFTSGKEALDILCDSKRVRNDLKRWLDTGFGETNIIVREWQYIDPSMEFRAFIHNGKLTAVSQYIHVCFFKELKERKAEVKEALRNFYDSVKDFIFENIYKSYVCDFAILQDGSVRILEINPFWNKTGPALFNWEGDADVIANGLADGDFEFRIVEVEWMRKENFALSRIADQNEDEHL